MAHLKEKVVLVTGAAGTIGAAIAEPVRSTSGTTIATDDALVEVT